MEICTHCQDFHKLLQLLFQEDSELTTRLEELRGLTMPAGTHTAKPLALLPGEVFILHLPFLCAYTDACTSQGRVATLLWLFEDELEAQKTSDKGELLSAGWYYSIQAARAVSASFVPGILVPKFRLSRDQSCALSEVTQPRETSLPKVGRECVQPLKSPLQFVHLGFLAGDSLQNGQGYQSPCRASCRPGTMAEPGLPLPGGRRLESRERAAAEASWQPIPRDLPFCTVLQ